MLILYYIIYAKSRGLHMTAKEYLMKLKILDVKINQKLEEISALRASLKSISSVNTTEERVKGGSSAGDARFVRTLAKIDKMEYKVDEEIDRFVDEKHKIINEIQELSNPLHIDILYKKYVEFKRLEAVAVELDKSYQYIVEVHGYALKEFANKFATLLKTYDNMC